MKNCVTSVLLLAGSVFGTVSAFGQVTKSVTEVLVTKRLSVLEHFLDKLPEHDKSTRVSWEIQRSLTPSFSEAVVSIEKSFPDKADPNRATLRNYHLNFIADENSVVYYKFYEDKYCRIKTGWVPCAEKIAEYRNASACPILEKEFKSIFLIPVNWNELFVTDFVYGEHCGIGSGNPEGRIQVQEFVKQQDKSNLLKWLQSTNTEKQLYAIDGLYQLSKLGIKLSAQEIKMIKFVLGKPGNVYTCGGCFFSHRSIAQEAKNFKF